MTLPVERTPRRGARPGLALALLLAAACTGTRATVSTARPTPDGGPGRSADDWLSWRGPHQDGTSSVKGTTDTIDPDGEGLLWTLDVAGRGTPTVAGDRVYVYGYEGEGPDLQEVLLCLDAATGAEIWSHRYNDWLSEVIYDRYSIGSPTVDPDTGNVYLLASAGEIFCYSPDGEELWYHSTTEEYGRLTFPNGRTGAVLIDGDRAIVHIITSGWGPQGPARDRFFAFDKRTGANIWSCTPGEGPKDVSFSFPVVTWQNGRRVLIAGTGCGNLVCVDTRTGDPLWRFPMAIGGVNSAAVLWKGDVIAIHGKENRDSSILGAMVRIPLGAEPKPGEEGPVVLDPSVAKWKNDLCAFTSSPVLMGGRVYVTTATGDLACVDPDTGKVLWREKLAPDQIHASPVGADGKLYVPMTNGTFHVVRPTDEGAEVLSQVQLAGSCLGAPSIGGGRIFVHTTEKLYCFAGGGKAPADAPVDLLGEHGARDEGPLGEAVRLQIVPGDLITRPGATIPLTARALDATGRVVKILDDVTWDIGPLDGTVVERSEGPPYALQLPADGKPGVAVIKAKGMGMTGTARVRVVAALPLVDDFEGYELKPGPDGTPVARPGGYWLGGFPKWDIREVDGSQVLAKTLENPLFQRVQSFLGDEHASNYTIQADLMTDGNRRTLSTAGLVNQRYLVLLKGNYQEIEVTSNINRIQATAPFKIKAGVWYTLKVRVDVAPDGSGVVRAKAWDRNEPEPEAWTIEVPHKNAHTQGAPGIYGFALQSRFRVYADNLAVTPNE